MIEIMVILEMLDHYTQWITYFVTFIMIRLDQIGNMNNFFPESTAVPQTSLLGASMTLYNDNTD
jgi:hypothetical protein